MEKKVERKENLEVVVTVSGKGDEWKKLVKKEYNKRAANVRVPGFRPGHAPDNMVRQRVDYRACLNDAMLNLVNKGFSEAVNENRLNVFSQPSISKVTKMNDEEVEAEVTFCLPPVIKLGQYKNLNIPMPEVKVSAKDVTAYIDNLKTQHAVMQVKEGAAAKGDSVIIDFTGFVDDVEFDGGAAKGYELELGSNSFIPGFEDQLVGIKAGESRTLNCKFPENYVENLKGKDARFEVTCQDVKEKILPEINADFIADLGIKEVTDEKSLKAYAKAQVTINKQRDARNAQVETIVNTAVANAEVQLPSSMINEEADAMLADIKKQVENAGLTYQDYVAINGLKEEELDANRKETAAKNLKSMLVVEKIIVEEHLEADEKAQEAEYEAIAKQYGMDVASVKNAFAQNKDQFVKQLRNRLFTEFMLARNAAPVAPKEAKAEAPAEAAAPAEEKAEKPAKKPAAKKPAAKKTAAKKEASGETKPAAKKTTKKAAKTEEEAK